VNYLLLRDDEGPLRRYLSDDLDLIPLANAAGPGTAAEPGTPDLPSHAKPSLAGRPSEFVYWAKQVGSLRRLGEAPDPASAKEKVGRILNEQVFGDDWVKAIDVARSPVIRFYRSSWNQNGCLNPGLLQAAAAPIKEQPDELLRILRQVERWLRAEGERLNPFEHCSKSPIAPPANLNAFWVWARPHALAWVRGGGEVWPWNA
jgi:hypothetical protein